MSSLALANVKKELCELSREHETLNPFHVVEMFLNGKTRRAIAGNTTLIQLDSNVIVACYHSTDVVKFYKDGTIVLFNGGYLTTTTKERINACTQFFMSVEQKNNNWYVHYAGRTYQFTNGMMLHSDTHTVTGSEEIVEKHHARCVCDTCIAYAAAIVAARDGMQGYADYS